jgi:hypothetical protein
MLIRLRRTETKLAIFAILVTAICCACFTSVKTLDKDKEQAKADRMVIRFHELYNASRFEEIYGLLDDSVRQSVNKDAFLSALEETTAKWGKVRDSKLSEGKVLLNNPVQVRAIYNITYEKGQGQEWFTSNIRGDDARLVHYTNAEGSDRPGPKKN